MEYELFESLKHGAYNFYLEKNDWLLVSEN